MRLFYIWQSTLLLSIASVLFHFLCPGWRRTNGSTSTRFGGKRQLVGCYGCGYTWWLQRSEHLLQVNLTSLSFCKMEHPSYLHLTPKMAALPGFWVPFDATAIFRVVDRKAQPSRNFAPTFIPTAITVLGARLYPWWQLNLTLKFSSMLRVSNHWGLQSLVEIFGVLLESIKNDPTMSLYVGRFQRSG